MLGDEDDDFISYQYNKTNFKQGMTEDLKLIKSDIDFGIDDEYLNL